MLLHSVVNLAAIVILEGRGKLECSLSVIISYSYNQIYRPLEFALGFPARNVINLQREYTMLKLSMKSSSY